MLHTSTIVESVGATVSAIEVLVDDHQRSHRVVDVNRAYCGARNDRAHPNRGERPDVGTVVDQVGRNAVIGAVSGKKCDRPSTKLPERERHGAVRGFDRGRFGMTFIEQAVQARTADYCDLCAQGLAREPLFEFLYRVVPTLFEYECLKLLVESQNDREPDNDQKDSDGATKPSVGRRQPSE